MPLVAWPNGARARDGGGASGGLNEGVALVGVAVIVIFGAKECLKKFDMIAAGVGPGVGSWSEAGTRTTRAASGGATLGLEAALIIGGDAAAEIVAALSVDTGAGTVGIIVGVGS